MQKWAREAAVPAVIAVFLALNGFLNLATGIIGAFKVKANLGLDKVPDYLQVSAGQSFSGLLSVFLGLALIVIGRGLYDRRRRSWKAALIVLALLMLNNLYRGTTPQTAVVSVVLIVLLLVFRHMFCIKSEGRFDYTQAITVASVIFALGYGIVGSYMLRDQFTGLTTWTDALYFTFVTYSTLGYGDILPKTPAARVFVTSMIPVGLASFVTALTALLGPMIERRVKGVLRIMRQFQKSNHVIVCGYSHVSESAIDELRERDVAFLIVDDRQDIVQALRSKGHDVFFGDATQRDTLDQANMKGASALIAAFDSDSLNILTAITAHDLRAGLKGCRCRIIVRVEDEENIAKARQVGADEVISPSTTAGRTMAAKAMGTDAGPA